MKLLKSFKIVILQLMAFRFLKQVGTTRSYNLVVAVNDDYILDAEGFLSLLDCSGPKTKHRLNSTEEI